MRFNLTVANMAVGIGATGVLASSASAEALDLVCTLAGSSQAQPVTIDLATGLVTNGTGYNARRWPARVTDQDVTRDEIFDPASDIPPITMCTSVHRARCTVPTWVGGKSWVPSVTKVLRPTN
jgi:hypothetical protein